MADADVQAAQMAMAISTQPTSKMVRVQSSSEVRRSKTKEQVAEMREQAQSLQAELVKMHAQEVHDEAMDAVHKRLEQAEMERANMEVRLVALEAANVEAKEEAKNKWRQQQAVIAMMGKSSGGSKGASPEELEAQAHVSMKVEELQNIVQHQAAIITQLHEDVAALTNLVCFPADSAESAEKGAHGPPIGSSALPVGYAAADAAGEPSASGAESSGAGPAADGEDASTAARRAPPTGMPALTELPMRALYRKCRLQRLKKEVGENKTGFISTLMTNGLEFDEQQKRMLGMIDDLDERFSVGSGAPMGYPTSGGSVIDRRLNALKAILQKEIERVESATDELTLMLDGHKTSTESQLAKLSDAAAEEAEKAKVNSGATSQEIGVRLSALEAEKASKFEFDALTTAFRETRASLLVASAGGSGGGGDPDAIASLQAAQQSTMGHVLSLQTHLRSLLRKAEMEKSSELPTVDISMIDDIKHELQAALSEIQTQMTNLHHGKADAERVEAALESKAERWLVNNKADRNFCEALLSRFAVEVGRQLGDMEQNQTSIRESLEEAIVKLMASSSDSAVGQVGTGHSSHVGINGMGGGGGGAEELNYNMGELNASAAGGQQAPLAVHPMRARSAGPTRRVAASAGRARGGVARVDDIPQGKGVLPISYFLTGQGELPQPDPQRYAFQPRRPAGLMTPGEQQLVRQRPRSSAGRLSQSASAGFLSGSGPGGGGAGGGAAAARPPSPPSPPMPRGAS